MNKLRLFFLLSFCWGLTGCADDLAAATSPVSATSPLTIPEAGVHPLETTEHLDPLLSQIGSSRYVLLGEASHGTAEFYTWRAAITRRLIAEQGFTLIGVEGEWPDLYELNRYVKGTSAATSAAAVLQQLDRWPTWMWANHEIVDLAEWLRTYNASQPVNRKVGFYGLDVYSMIGSLESIRRDFADADAATRDAVDQALACLQPYRHDEQSYDGAGSSATRLLNEVLLAVRNRARQLPAGHEGAFNAGQNALVAVNAESYYRASVRSNTASWNIRDRHMAQTITRLTSFHGPDARIVVWEHNTHVGDARYTDMAGAGMVNVGQLVRQEHAAEGVYIVGFGTYEGSVIASPYWGGPVSRLPVPQAQPGSWEATLHQQGGGNKLILLQGWRDNSRLTEYRGNRAIGVVYDPDSEHGNYVTTNLPRRYDAFLFIDQTQALHPL